MCLIDFAVKSVYFTGSWCQKLGKSTHQLQEGIVNDVFDFRIFRLYVGLYLTRSNFSSFMMPVGCFFKCFSMPFFQRGLQYQERSLLDAAIFALHGHAIPETFLEPVTWVVNAMWLILSIMQLVAAVKREHNSLTLLRVTGETTWLFCVTVQMIQFSLIHGNFWMAVNGNNRLFAT